jgi:hypothetical protein
MATLLLKIISLMYLLITKHMLITAGTCSSRTVNTGI